ncbi:hypothetical protein EAF04_003009 [Stromatinia cepivora]|nr:hypothetical protein EAF04_003009 [Stromatinia cepivora]
MPGESYEAASDETIEGQVDSNWPSCSRTYLQKYVSLLISRLHDQALEEHDGATLDIVPWLNYTTFDIFGDLGFGESFNCLQHSRYHPWISLLFNSAKAASFVIAARFYPWFDYLLMRCIPPGLKKMQQDHYQQIVDKVTRRLNWEVERPDLMAQVIKHIGAERESEESMSLGEIQATFMVLTTAGSETTATALSGILTYLLKESNCIVFEELVNEIRGRFAEEQDITLERLGELGFLNAVIQEELRLCPPIPMMFPRIVPEGGDTVCDVWLPAGTSISLPSYHLFRSPVHFHNPNSFVPSRWLPCSTSPDLNTNSLYKNDNREVVQAFSVGPRQCMGKHLAWAEMRLVLAK